MRALSIPLVLLAVACGGERAGPDEVTLAAAVSLRAALPELIAAYQAREPAVRIRVTYGSSGALRRQVEAGAPVDGVVFAGAAPVDALIAAGHVDASSRRIVATNEIVLVGRPGGPAVDFASLERLPPGERIAIGDPSHVPAGTYARDALVSLGTWDAVQDRLVLGGDVAAVLAYARRGEVAAAIVFRTEVQGVTDLAILDRAEGAWAPRPMVVAAVLAAGPRRDRAAGFLRFLLEPEAQRVLGAHGFGPPPSP